MTILISSRHQHSLVTYDQMEPRPASPSSAPLRTTGETPLVCKRSLLLDGTYTRPACGSQTCPACLVRMALNRAWALGLAAPRHQIGLTLVGDSWSVIKKKVKALHRSLRSRMDPQAEFEHAFVVEQNPLGTGTHLHGWVHSDGLDHTMLADAAIAAGMGSHTWMGPVQTHLTDGSHPMIKYPFKAVLDHPDSPSELWPSATRHLELNGGKLICTTRGFWRDGETGERFSGVRAAVRESHQRRHGAHASN